MTLKQRRGAGVRAPSFPENPSLTIAGPLHVGFPPSELTLEQCGCELEKVQYKWTRIVQTGVDQRSAVLAELRVGMLAHMLRFLFLSCG